MQETKLESPYLKAKRKGLKSKKKKMHLQSDRPQPCWDISGPRDAFNTHPLALKAQVYGSSNKI